MQHYYEFVKSNLLDNVTVEETKLQVEKRTCFFPLSLRQGSTKCDEYA